MRIALVTLALGLLAVPCRAGTVELVGPVTVFPGQTATTWVILSDDVRGVAGGYVNLTSEEEDKPEPALSIKTSAGQFLAGAFHGDPVEPHGFTWLFLTEDKNGPGELMQVEITAAPREPTADLIIPLRVSGRLMPATGDFPIPVDFVDSSVIIPGAKLGDANGDGLMNVLDIRKILLTLVKLDEMSEKARFYADVWPLDGDATPHGGDGSITVQDAITLLQALVHLVKLPG